MKIFKEGLSKQKRNSILSTILVSILIILTTLYVNPVVHAESGQTIASNASASNATYNASTRGLCFSNGFYIAVYLSSTSHTLNYVSSQNGAIATWSSPQVLISTVDTVGEWAIYCDNNGNIYLAWTNSANTDQWEYQTGTTSNGIITLSGSPAIKACVQATFCGVNSIYAFDTSHVWLVASSWDGTTAFGNVWSCVTSPCSNNANWNSKLDDGTNQCLSASGFVSCEVLGLNNPNNIAYITTTNTVGTGFEKIRIRTSSDGGATWATAVQTTNTYFAISRYSNCESIVTTIFCSGFQGDQKTLGLAIMNWVSVGPNAWSESTITTLGTTSSAVSVSISTDGNNIIVIYSDTSSTALDKAISTLSSLTWTINPLVTNENTATAVNTTPTLQNGLIGIYWSSTTNLIRFTLLGSAVGSTTIGSTQQAIGSCPVKNTATFTPVNNTIYLYYATATGTKETVNQISTFIASIVGSGSHTFQFLIYTTSATTIGTIGVNSPLNLAFSYSKSITSGTTNSPFNVAVAGVTINNPQMVAIGFVADNKIKINQSSFSGLYTLTGNPSTSSQPTSFTNGGTSVGTQVYLCAIATYQVTVTTVSTTSIPATTTQTVTTTSALTSLVSPSGSAFILNDLLVFLPLWIFPLLFAKLLGTTGLLYGLMIALLLGIFMGLFPYWVIFIVIVMIYLLLR